MDEQPICQIMVFDYSMSTLGAYSEFVHTIQVTYERRTFDYTVILILDNESEIFAGREQWGFPKVFGHVDLKTKTGSSYISARVERPVREHVVQLGFTPLAEQESPSGVEMNPTLSLGVVPGVHQNASPAVKELVSSRMLMTGGHFWFGKGCIAYPIQNALSPSWNLPVVAPIVSFYWANTNAELG